MAGMNRLVFSLALVAAAAAWTSSASAQGLIAGYQSFEADFHTVCDRNAAWPQPFKCRDRFAYFNMMQTNIDYGWQVSHTLTEMHFDAETNQLNQAGKAKISWIFRNSPIHRRTIYVYEPIPGEVTEQRLANVRELVDQWYGHLDGTLVATSQYLPSGTPGQYQEKINEKYYQTLPSPTLPTSSGSSVSSSVSQ